MEHVALKRINREIDQTKREIDRLTASLQYMEEKRNKMLRLSTICPKCNGTGEEKGFDVVGSVDWRTCSVCLGLGKLGPYVCECGNTISVMMFLQYVKHCPWCGKELKR